MKNLLLAVILLPLFSYSQELKRNEVDKYTKSYIKETTWEPLSIPFTRALRQRIKSINENNYIELRITLHSAFRVDEGDKVYFLFDNDESISLECVRGGVADYNYSTSSSFWWGDYLYKLSPEIITAIKKHLLTGVRIGMGSEYITFDKVKEKNAVKLRRAIQLIGED